MVSPSANPRLNERKATQAAARFLESNGGHMHHLKLLKLLYLLDREALLRWGFPVTNDVYHSLPHGPVPSGCYDLVLSEEGFWADHISSPHEHVVTLLDQAQSDELSKAEKSLIDELSTKFKKFDRFAWRDYTHSLPEWQNPNGSRVLIRIEDILRAGNKSEDQIRIIVENIVHSRVMHDLFPRKPGRLRQPASAARG